MQQKKNRECAETRARIQKVCLKNWETQINLLTKKCHVEVTKEVPKSSINKCRAIFANIWTQVSRSNKLQEVSFVADDALEGDVPSKFLTCQLPPKELNPGSFTLPCTICSLNLYAMADLGASINVMPKSMFEHLKLANLKETDMLVKMDDMTRKAPLEIVENILVKINKFLFPSDFIIINMLGEPSETMILGTSFLATIQAQIDVFNREISLGIGEDRVLFDMDGGMYHSKILVEKVYMANSFQEEESFNLLEIGDDLFSYESPALFYDNECGKDCEMWPTCNPDLSFCSGYDAIYGKGEHGMLVQWMCFWDNERQSVGGNHMIFADFLKVLDSLDIEADYGRTRNDPYERSFDEYKRAFDNEVE
ncbi:phospholipase-like protein [Tanacetum coccineum]